MKGLYTLAVVVFVVVCIAVVFFVRRQRRMLAESRRLEMERAMEQDAMRRASAKLKYMNSSSKRKRGEGEGEAEHDEQDPLKDLFGMEVPTDFRPASKKKN